MLKIGRNEVTSGTVQIVKYIQKEKLVNSLTKYQVHLIPSNLDELIQSALIQIKGVMRERFVENIVCLGAHQQQGIADSAAVLILCKYCIVLNTNSLLFSSIYVNIVLFSTQRSFVFKHLCKYCIVLDTQRSDVKKLSQQTRCSIVF